MAGPETLLKLLQATGDVTNFPTEIEDIEAGRAPINRDPALRALMDSGALDPFTRSILIQRDDRRIQQERAQREIEELQEKLRPGADKNDRGLISFIGPVPIGFQLGTFAGIENPVFRFLADLVLDPVNLISGVGTLTKIGRASKFLTRAGKVVPPRQMAETIAEGARLLARKEAGLFSSDEMLRLTDALSNHSPAKLKDFLKEFSKKPLSKVELDKVRGLDIPGADDLARLLANEKDTVRGLTAAFKVKDEALDAFLKADVAEQFIRGQRAFVKFGIPFTDKEFASVSLSGLVKSIKEGSLLDAVVTKPISKAIENFQAAGLTKARLALSDTINLGDSMAVARNLDKTVDSVLRIVDDTAKYAGDGQNIVKNVGNDLNAITAQSNAIGANLQVQFADDIDELTKISFALEDSRKISTLSGKGQIASEKMRFMFDEMRDRALKAGVLEDDFFDHYVTHVMEFTGKAQEKEFIDFLRKALEGGGKGRAIRSRFSFERSLETFEIADEWVLKNPTAKIRFKTKRIDQLAPIYLDSMGKAIVRNNLIDTLAGPGARMAGLDGKPLVISGKALAEAAEAIRQRPSRIFPTTGARAVDAELGISRRATRKDLMRELRRRFGDEYVVPENPTFSNKFAVHRSLKRDILPIFERDLVKDQALSGSKGWQKFLRAADVANSAMKATIFGLNPFFHSMSLMYSNFALLPPGAAIQNSVDTLRVLIDSKINPENAARTLIKMRSRAFSTMHGVKGAAGEMLDAEDLVELMLRSGVQLGRADLGLTEGFKIIDQALQGAERLIPESAQLVNPFTGVKHLNRMSDFALWSIVHDNLKMTAFAHILHAERLKLAKKGIDLAGARLRDVAGEIAQIVNPAFGGLNWERLAISPTAQRFFRWGLIAPDWTMSNLLMARDMFVNMPIVRKLAGKSVPGFGDIAKGADEATSAMLRDIRFRWALGYNMRAAFYGVLATNALNYAFTSVKYGEGRFLFNDPSKEARAEETGLPTQVELPYNREDGRALRMNILKQFVEPVKLIRSPAKFLSGKMGVLPRVFSTTVIGVDSFGNKIAGTTDGPYQDITKRLFTVSGQFLPISAQSLAGSISGRITGDPGRGEAADIISSLLGVGVRSETKTDFKRRQQLAELRAGGQF